MMFPKTLAAGLLLGLAGCTFMKRETNKDARGQENADRFTQASFRAPANTYRSVPFYAMNDELKPAEMDRQLRAFKEGGFGGVFFHSRIGLLEEYLGDRWFEAMAAGVKTSKELGLDSWFYDEDRWPSGYAGGIVPLKDPAFQARSLARVNKGQAVTAPDTVLFEDSDYRYVCHVDPLGQARYNGTSWVDLMNPYTVKAFINCTYKSYKEKFGGENHVRGIFSDEPHIVPKCSISNRGVVGFSPVVPAVFKTRTGYDLIPNLPSLFSQTGDWRNVRLDYYRTLAACFEQSFARQIGDYCAANGIIWTGHYDWEDTLCKNMRASGNLMQQYRHMQMPGIDTLGIRYGTVYCGKVMTSVANQYGRRRRLCEIFAVSGHNMTFEDRMWIISWHTLMGVNFMCPSILPYSLKGERKRDYPPFLGPQQPYWRYNRLVEDCSARLAYFATVGRTEPEICVLNPIESVYIENTGKLSGKRDNDYESLLNELMRTHRNFDLGDEQILSEIGKVEKDRFIVGRMAYRAVVVPQMLTIRASTLALLKWFADQGGTVLVAEEYPSFVDGRENSADLQVLKNYAPLVKADGWVAALNAKFKPAFAIDGANNGEVWTHLRAVANGRTLQLSNTSRFESRTIALRFGDPAVPVALWNPVNGQCLRLRPEFDGAHMLAFAPGQTWIVSTGDAARGVAFDADYRVPSGRKELVKLDDRWIGKRVDPNALTLDFARFSRDGGATWSEPEPVLAFYDRCAKKAAYNGPLQLKFEPQVADVPASCKLVVEQPAMYSSITVNGNPVNFAGSGFYRDSVFRTQDINGLLKPGRNEIILSLDFVAGIPGHRNACQLYGTEIESVYLIGDFAVKADIADHPLTDTDRNRTGLLPKKPINSFRSFTLAKEKTSFNGDLAQQGYPFYAGEFLLEGTFNLPAVQPGKKSLLVFPFFEAVVLNVTVNGTPCPPLFASPWETDVTAALKPGKNTVRVSLANSLRNLMGPHHHKGGEHADVGPTTFRGNHYWSEGKGAVGEADWYDVRLGGNAKVWRDDYYMIPFGLLQPPELVQVD